MATKNSAKVMIGNKIITLGGYESEEYLQRVANHINHRLEELSEITSFRRMTPEMRGIMLAINVADDYFKAKDQADAIEQDMEAKDRDSYNIKQNLVSAQLELDELRKELRRNRR